MDGIEYELVIPALHENPDMTPEELAVVINQSASTNPERTGSAVALNEDWDALIAAVDAWAIALENGLPEYRQHYVGAFRAAKYFWQDRTARDLYDVASIIGDAHRRSGDPGHQPGGDGRRRRCGARRVAPPELCRRPRHQHLFAGHAWRTWTIHPQSGTSSSTIRTTLPSRASPTGTSSWTPLSTGSSIKRPVGFQKPDRSASIQALLTRRGSPAARYCAPIHWACTPGTSGTASSGSS